MAHISVPETGCLWPALPFLLGCCASVFSHESCLNNSRSGTCLQDLLVSDSASPLSVKDWYVILPGIASENQFYIYKIERVSLQLSNVGPHLHCELSICSKP